MRRRLLCLSVILLALWPVSAYGADPVLITPKWDSPSTPANGNVWPSAISPDGRYVLFCSEATDLVPVDTNGEFDVFIYERNTGTVEMISPPTTDGAQPNGGSVSGGMSADGRYVGFTSRATNLVGGGMEGTTNPYVYDRQTGALELVNVADDGTPGDAGGPRPLLSADGRHVCFESPATNLVPGDTNECSDVFVRDRKTGHTERVSLDTDGSQLAEFTTAPQISPDGRYVTFCRPRTDLSPPDATSRLFIHDRVTHTTDLVNLDASGTVPAREGGGTVYMSGDGRFLAFPGTHDTFVENDTNGVRDAFLRDRSAGTIELVSYNASGEQFAYSTSPAGISADARFVVLYACLQPSSGEPWPEYPYLRDRIAGVTIEPGTRGGVGGISANGRFLCLEHHYASKPYHAACLWEPELLDFGTIAGAVTASDSGDPVAGAPVWIGGTLLTVTDADGNYSMEVAVTGDTSVRAELEGYVNAVETGVAVTAGAVTPIDLVLHPQPFPDVDADSWAAPSVAGCVEAGIVGGYEDGMYHGEVVVTRDQMAVYIARGMAGGDENIPDASAYPTPSFTDVPADNWAYRHVEYAAANDVVGGYGEGTYEPGSSVDRGQMAVFVSRSTSWVSIHDDMTTAPELFPDVPAGFWAGTALQACVTNGVVHGYEDGSYHPELLVTRDQLAVYVARAFGL